MKWWPFKTRKQRVWEELTKDYAEEARKKAHEEEMKIVEKIVSEVMNGDEKKATEAMETLIKAKIKNIK